MLKTAGGVIYKHNVYKSPLGEPGQGEGCSPPSQGKYGEGPLKRHYTHAKVKRKDVMCKHSTVH